MNENTTRRADRSAPLAVLVLGMAGLLPFIGSAGLYLLMAEERWLEVLRAYAAVIASFVGALQWGYAVRDGLEGASAWRAYGWSVLPALAGWVSLLLPVPIGLQLLAATLLLCLVVDRAFARAAWPRVASAAAHGTHRWRRRQPAGRPVGNPGSARRIGPCVGSTPPASHRLSLRKTRAHDN